VKYLAQCLFSLSLYRYLLHRKEPTVTQEREQSEQVAGRMPPKKKNNKVKHAVGVCYSPRVTRGAVKAANAKKNILLSPPEDGLLELNLFPFLGVNELTVLSAVSSTLHNQVSCCRSKNVCTPSGLYLVAARVEPTKIRYETIGNDEETGAVVETHQIQRFSFVFCSSVHQTVTVDFALQNLVWEEINNHRVTPQGSTATVSSIAIMQPEILHGVNVQVGKRLFINRPGSGWCFLGEHGGANNYLRQDLTDRPENEKQELREAMHIIMMCARQMAAFNKGSMVYPSAEYIMSSLPKWLHTYFSADAFDRAMEYSDRETEIEFEYRPAPTLEAWQYALPLIFDAIEYGPDEKKRHFRHD